jgi:hypothetical protein
MERIKLEKVKTFKLSSSPRKVSIQMFGSPPKEGISLREFLISLPKILGAKDLLEVARAIVQAKKKGKKVLLGMGAHPIKVGLTPYLIELMKRNVLSLIGTNGASMVHDVEIALVGKTSEDVKEGLKDGSFGFAEESTTFINEALKRGLPKGKGAGEALGEAIWEEKLPYRELSLFGMAYKLGTPITVHIAIGTDVYHMHPSANGSVIGEMSYRDFLTFSSEVTKLSEGIYLNLGSATIMPEVFLKALSLARNLGYKVENYITVNMDFLPQYRALENVLHRPHETGGRASYFLRGHHEILFPLLVGAIIEGLTGDI